MTRILLFNKPYGVLTQFTDQEGRETLKDYINVKHVYSAGRLDKDSEGLLVLTDDGKLQARLADPKNKTPKTYLVQVEGVPSDTALENLMKGVDLKDGMTKPAHVEVCDQPPEIWPRTPPIRVRLSVPDTWIKLTIKEGRNRQIRRMTAAVGFPTLRLVRTQIGSWSLDGLAPGQFREVKQ